MPLVPCFTIFFLENFVILLFYPYRFLGEADLESSLTDEDFIMPVILHNGLRQVFDALPEFNFVPIISSPGRDNYSN